MAKIAVIGMGQGGMVAAVRLAKQGHEVTIFEKNKRGEVSYDWRDDIRADVFEAAGLPMPPSDVYCQKSKWLFVSPNEEYSLPVPPCPPMEEISVYRTKLSEYFATLAQEAGCKLVFETEVKSLAVQNDAIVGVCAEGKEELFDLVIDASGMRSPFRAQVPNKFEIQAKPFNIRHILDEVYAIYGAQMSAKQIEFEFDASRVRYENLLGDELSLQKILNNLLSNAFKFTPSGGKVSLTAAQKTASDKSVVMHFEVKDTGIGMSPEFKKHIFEPYTQETAENGTKASGSGLGMAICKSMVDLQGGSISVESVQGEGTSFYIDIPYALSAPLKKDDDGENGTPDCSVLCGKRILVVDDVMINTVITGRLLEKQGVLVDCAENGKAALDMFTSHKDFYYDCILMDIQMPVMDGFEAAASIRAIKRRYALSVPIIAMTADAFIRELKNGSMNDFDDYIIKPVKPKDLYSNLVELFKNS